MKKKKGTNTSIESFSLDKVVAQHLNDAFKLSSERSKSKFLSNLLRLTLEKKEYSDRCLMDNDYPHDGEYKKTPDEFYLSWYKSMCIRKIKDFITSDDNWFILNTGRVAIYDENSEIYRLKGKDETAKLNNTNELNSLNVELLSLYYKMKRRRGVFSLGDPKLSRVIFDLFKNKNIKILALRVRDENNGYDKFYKNDYEYHSYTYLFTIVDAGENINGKTHYYLDYHSIKIVSASYLYERPIRDIVRNEFGGVPLHYLHWIPIRTYNQNFILLGVKRRKYSKDEIDHVKKNKVIIVNAT
ncbi:hypothetical protein [Pectobacterium carotovorum]|uniref:hypothetical protein n=1 Tax=Pectobacterium carotovorum TaxID=554 RepID=UPI00191D9C89|nr:hypothetical protein [Pectobacterium carotovorum]